MQIPGAARVKIPTFTRPAPVVNFYYQTTSLNRIDFYGLGPNTLRSAQTSFGLTESIVGISTNVPVPYSPLDPLGISLLGEANGRFPSIRGNHDSASIPSIETLYDETTAPGLLSQPSVAQFGEGIRFVPALPYNRFRLNYLLNFQQFLNSTYGFRRLTVDLNHQLPLYGTRTVKSDSQPSSASSPTYVPLSAGGLPSASTTKDFTGSLSFRLLLVESPAKAGRVVPFYFDPTIGGSDLNSNAMLPSYPDYRFRAPNLVLLRGSFEQALGKLPIGLFVSIDAGKSARRAVVSSSVSIAVVTVAGPWASISSSTRVVPRRHAASCASRSPSVEAGSRTLAVAQNCRLARLLRLTAAASSGSAAMVGFAPRTASSSSSSHSGRALTVICALCRISSLTRGDGRFHVIAPR